MVASHKNGSLVSIFYWLLFCSLKALLVVVCSCYCPQHAEIRHGRCVCKKGYIDIDPRPNVLTCDTILVSASSQCNFVILSF